MKIVIVNGINKPVSFNHEAIKREAGFDTGQTSIVIAEKNNTQFSISNHECGDWDVSINEEHYDTFDDPDEAVKTFMNLIVQRQSHG